jgi:hypothetical protein
MQLDGREETVLENLPDLFGTTEDHGRRDRRNGGLHVPLLCNAGEEMTTGFPEDVLENFLQTETGTVQDLMDPVLDGRSSPNKGFTIPGQIPELTISPAKDSGRSDQAVESQLGNPPGIVDIRLPSGNILDLARIGYNDRDLRLKFQIETVPIDPGGFQGDHFASFCKDKVF